LPPCTFFLFVLRPPPTPPLFPYTTLFRSFTLADFGPTPIGGVAGRLGIGLPAGSSLVDRLVEQGLVKRRGDPLDRRRTPAETTEIGRAQRCTPVTDQTPLPSSPFKKKQSV